MAGWWRLPVLKRKGSAAVVAFATLALVTVLHAFDPGFVANLRDVTFDSYQRISPRPYGDPPVRVVAIDDESLAAYGQWPWPRTRLAELTEQLTGLGAATVAFAVIFAEPDRLSAAQVIDGLPGDKARQSSLREALAGLPDNDAIFAQALRTSPSVLGFGFSTAPNDRRPLIKTSFAHASADPLTLLQHFYGATPNLPVLEEAAKGIGALNMPASASSGLLRRLSLYVADEKKVYPGLVVEALRVAQGARTVVLRGTGASGELGGAGDALIDTRVGDVKIPMTSDGEFWMYYDHERPERRVSARDILDPARREAVRSQIEGQIVFVGVTATGLADLWTTSLGETVQGVIVQAQATEQILSGSFLTRPDYAKGLERVATVVLGVLVLVLALVAGPRWSLFAGALMVGLAVGASWLAFSRAQLLFDPVYPSLGAFTVHLAVTGMLFISTDRERRFVRRAFGQYLAPQLLSELEKAPDRMVLGGEIRPLTIMFMDVRDFTPISEAISATDLVHFLNALLSPLSDAIQAEGGTIDKYIGDSIMAFWNAPLDVADHPRAACRAALAMRGLVREMNGRDSFGFEALGRSDLKVKIGIGLNTGDACVGNMGSQRRFNYSAVGDAVNIAARIESASKSFGTDILVSEDTARACPDFAFLEVDEVALKGKSRPLPLLALYGDESVRSSQDFVVLAGLHRQMMAALRSADAAAASDLASRCRDLADPHFASLYEVFAERAAALRTGSRSAAE
ncbi:CHASE2 domain-containing protein [uncultured Alsobacter sp.]|uniref:CHASE2 domain-containing protein n=1 Tax=uncultured Alsobacter sp. TaxID=1748258 RepID=UPI0025FD8E5B|nr:adenylate/guanylate cyclase domain-containing protein [uncultured Alsobacter sp.]